MKNTRPLFGVAGYPPNFFLSSYKSKRENIFRWLHEIDLDWVELQNTYGVKMPDKQAYLYHDLALEYNIGVSLHAPYYITLASSDPEIVARSKERVIQCFCLASKIGAKRIIFHPGFYPGKDAASRAAGLDQIVESLNSIVKELPEDDIYIYPETAGKRSQIGSVDDIIYICRHVSYARPCIDVAHVHGFENGAITSQDKIDEILNHIETELGREILDETHFHMYPVEVDNNGEKRHRAFEDRIEYEQMDLFNNMSDNRYYPLPEHFINALHKKNLNPVIICEAKDTQDTGAKLMKSLYYHEDEGRT